jgi:hypothetical protein
MKAIMDQQNNYGPAYFAAAILLKVFAWISSASLHEAFSYFGSAGAGFAGFMGGWHYWVVIRENRKKKKQKR